MTSAVGGAYGAQTVEHRTSGRDFVCALVRAHRHARVRYVRPERRAGSVMILRTRSGEYVCRCPACRRFSSGQDRKQRSNGPVGCMRCPVAEAREQLSVSLVQGRGRVHHDTRWSAVLLRAVEAGAHTTNHDSSQEKLSGPRAGGAWGRRSYVGTVGAGGRCQARSGAEQSCS